MYVKEGPVQAWGGHGVVQTAPEGLGWRILICLLGPFRVLQVEAHGRYDNGTGSSKGICLRIGLQCSAHGAALRVLLPVTGPACQSPVFLGRSITCVLHCAHPCIRGYREQEW
jgi:hypothetical protein